MKNTVCNSSLNVYQVFIISVKKPVNNPNKFLVVFIQTRISNMREFSDSLKLSHNPSPSMLDATTAFSPRGFPSSGAAGFGGGGGNNGSSIGAVGEFAGETDEWYYVKQATDFADYFTYALSFPSIVANLHVLYACRHIYGRSGDPTHLLVSIFCQGIIIINKKCKESKRQER